jgi:hypothetical protein
MEIAHKMIVECIVNLPPDIQKQIIGTTKKQMKTELLLEMRTQMCEFLLTRSDEDQVLLLKECRVQIAEQISVDVVHTLGDNRRDASKITNMIFNNYLR